MSVNVSENTNISNTVYFLAKKPLKIAVLIKEHFTLIMGDFTVIKG